MHRFAWVLAGLLLAASPQDGGKYGGGDKPKSDPDSGKGTTTDTPKDTGAGGGGVAGGGGKTLDDGRSAPSKENKCCCNNGIPKDWPLYNKGVQWTQDLEKAIKKAQDERKLLMVVHFVGRMDKEGC